MKSCKKFLKKYKLPLIISLVFILGITSFFVSQKLLSPSITLLGKKEVTVNLHGHYEEEGVKANCLGKDVGDEVKIEGKVDTEKEGTYTITYRIKENGIEKKVERKVIVKDIEPPTITLEGDKEVTICDLASYQELGYHAMDNADGDITDKVKITKDEEKIVYEVSDNNGNKATETRYFKIEDNEAPVITLNGGEILSIVIGNSYKELGYKASDNCMGDVTNKVKVSGSVDTGKLGTYEITYTVEDLNGHKTTTKRVVNVISREKAGVIYLTFDDGPKEGTTNVILDILKEEGVKATFFVTNSGPDYLIKREADEGHTVALHTASHEYDKVYVSVESYFNDLASVQARVKRLTGKEANIIRFPGGSSNTISRNYCQGIMSQLTKEVLLRGYHYFDWNVSAEDAGGAKTSSSVYKNVTSSLSKSRANVVLLHDIKAQTRDALRDIIQYGKMHGYTFEAITYDTPMVTHKVNN